MLPLMLTILITVLIAGCTVEPSTPQNQTPSTVDIEATIGSSVNQTVESINDADETESLIVATPTEISDIAPTTEISPATVVPDAGIQIIGTVANGTQGGELPIDLEILLLSIDPVSNQIIEQESTYADSDGAFQFDNLISGSEIGYRVVANAGDYTPSVDMGEVGDWHDVHLSIYDETRSLEYITINSYVMMIPTIDAQTRQVGVLTVVNVDNRGDKVWIPDITDSNLTGVDLLRFNLPEGFSDLSVESELPPGNILEIDIGFAITNPIPPGESAILISYIIPYEGDSFDFNLKLPYGASEVRMLLIDEDGTIKAGGFGPAESVVVADIVFNQFEGKGFQAGSEIEILFSGLPQPISELEVDSPRTDFGDGTWRIGIDVEPGTYFTEASDGCYWQRLTGFSGSFSEILANDNTDARAIVEILPSDAGFDSSRCGEWNVLQSPLR